MKPIAFRLLLAASLTSLIARPAISGGNPDFRPIAAGELVTIRPDRAYILVRSGRGLVLLRAPDAGEQAQYRTLKLAALTKMKKPPAYADFDFTPSNMHNVYNLWAKKPFEEVAPLPVLPVQLIETMPGNYVVYGAGGPNAYLVCFCLGTVGFTAKAGEITDIGTFMTDRADTLSIFPELASETGIGVTAAGDFPLSAAAIRPYRSSDRLPPAIAGMRRIEAKFTAIGPYLDRQARNINRLAAIPNVLAYDRGQVIDVQSGKIIPPR